ncbi:MAG: DUF4113 domain-containing protein [Parachlamydiaceae bacterium]
MSHYVLADCNNFYVSCERLFNPALEGKPVVVLSQNDGCIIARSQEAKDLGLKMGVPYFKAKQLCETGKVIVFSCNHQLYGDISQRVMNVLTSVAPEIEVYSVDEAFMRYPHTMKPEEIEGESLRIKQLVKKLVGIPISIGIAPTKTLAKAANILAKKELKKKNTSGILNLNDPQVRNAILQNFPIEDVWGIGFQISQKLRGLGIFTAWDFMNMDPSSVRKKFGVTGEKMLWELRGVSTLGLQKVQPRKSISISRSFAHIITDFSALSEALATFVGKACVKLRKQKSCTSAIQVFVESIAPLPEDGASAQYARANSGAAASFAQPTNDTSQVISTAIECLHQLFDREGKYKKCGVFLLDLIPEDKMIPDLFSGGLNPKRSCVMRTVDSLNQRYGKNTIFFGAMGVRDCSRLTCTSGLRHSPDVQFNLEQSLNQRWSSRSERSSLHNTTSWDHLPIAYAM